MFHIPRVEILTQSKPRVLKYDWKNKLPLRPYREKNGELEGGSMESGDHPEA